MALVHSLITSRLSEMTWTDRDLVQRALLDLHGRGFSIEQAKKTLRRMRTRYVDAAVRAGEADENCGPAIGLPGGKNDMPF
ncbi:MULTISPECIES: hypothetical protein [Bradyrhizobium]|uniref:hypothetical protein n=1 Tax=Bradyrhizobium TaxID=374 RepID=UPI001EDB0D1E|nr:hypothetical protein [Bradyrhizobium zhengyangense]MCG2645195.1 hypothetical protein [Bradyrhizobium zhengyangense]